MQIIFTKAVYIFILFSKLNICLKVFLKMFAKISSAVDSSIIIIKAIGIVMNMALIIFLFFLHY